MQTNVIRWALVVGAILMIPFVTKAPWTAMDYFFAGTVLFGSATIFEYITQRMNATHRTFVGMAILAIVLLIWAWAVA